MNLMYVGRWRQILERFQLASSWKDASFGKSEAEVGNFFAPKVAFWKVDFDYMLDQWL